MDVTHEKQEESRKEVDFFEEHSSFPSFQSDRPDDDFEYHRPPNAAPAAAATGAAALSGKGPTVDLSAPASFAGERKSIIGGRKPPAKKSGVSF